jgi:uncharacterized NAD-dependent epimerase/dehydratase family protein
MSPLTQAPRADEAGGGMKVVVIAGTSSGVGKTSVALGLMVALR